MLGVSLVLSACQAVFTYSPFSFLQRDLASLPPEQQVTRAQDALSTGDTDSIAAAYIAITDILEATDTPDPELSLLAADLAFAASGMTDVFTQVLQDPESLAGATSEDFTDTLESLDIELIAEGATHVKTAMEADAEVSSTQYVIAGLARLASAVEQAGSFDDVVGPEPTDAWYEDMQDAESFLTLSGAPALLEMFNL